jgi:uncharacterized protein involved in exopolysaccharide biosynthesis
MNPIPVAASSVPNSPTMSLNDILYILFRHKWKILICTVLGLGAATAIYFFDPPPFQSEAMLFIRYVTEDSAPGLPDGGAGKAVSLADLERGATILDTEIDILSSMDIADQAAEALGPDKILTQVKDPKQRDRARAAAAIRSNLSIEPLPRSSVIQLVYKNADPSVVQPVLTAVIDAYYKKHVEVHRQAAAIGDFLSQETDQLRAQLEQTEDELRKEKDKAGIVSLDDAQKTFNDQESKLEAEIFSAQAELAERSARYNNLIQHMPGAAKAVAASAGPAPAMVPPDIADTYRNLLARIDYLHRTEQDLLSQFTDENQRVKEIRSQLAAAEQKRDALEMKYPRLPQMLSPQAALAASPTSTGPTAAGEVIDLRAEAAYLAGLKSEIKILDAELAQVKASAASVDGVATNISELERQKELQEANYKYYAEHLEATRIDEALGSGRALNIAEIQTPTAPSPDFKKFYKTVGGVGVSGLAIGLAWALLIEFYLDRSIRRPQDVERGLRIPLFLSIPDFGKNGHNKHVFHETLRDRLVAYFESRDLTHKPKLVAVTGVGRNSGVTTTAAGLAKSLSEAGDGNVLLVDMTQSQGSAQSFAKGSAVCGIDQMIGSRTDAKVEENLYVVGAEPNNEQLTRALPTRFNRLVPQLKKSDFDYIIFDMPAVNQISITPRLAQYMDMVLLVLESEETDRDIAREAAVLLAQSRAHVGAVLNKSRNYGPSRAQSEFLGA